MITNHALLILAIRKVDVFILLTLLLAGVQTKFVILILIANNGNKLTTLKRNAKKLNAILKKEFVLLKLLQTNVMLKNVKRHVDLKIHVKLQNVSQELILRQLIAQEHQLSVMMENLVLLILVMLLLDVYSNIELMNIAHLQHNVPETLIVHNMN
jgi:hypothetical protein